MPAKIKSDSRFIMPEQTAERSRLRNERVLESSPIHEDAEADAYAHMVERRRGLLNAPFAAYVSRVGIEKARVLDIGCGPGWIPCELACRHPGWSIVALDPSESMLAKGREEALQRKVDGQVAFKRGAADDLPFTNASFDLVISNYVLHHVEAPETMLNEAARVLRPNGRLIVKDLLRLPRWQAEALLGFSRLVLGYDETQLNLYAESLRAAFTLHELREAVARTSLKQATVRRFRIVDAIIDVRM